MTVVFAFQGPVSQNLVQNPADLTNEILNNLTTILYEISALNGLKVPISLPPPAPFKPARSDEILSMLWYISLNTSVRMLLSKFALVN